MFQPLLLAAGARAGLSLEQIDDLAMAIELVLAHASPDDLRAEISIAPGDLQIALMPVDLVWVERRRTMFDALVAEVGGDSGRVMLRARA
ncbi:MAG: hypothetical protein QOJ13_1192 [Gaiellales bacterium]|nr:hypothetical protein [Gaiellales bacterium]